ncbi:EXS family-domain-containing protein [Pilobolus umbonatus]|nr:EXS family-domain-containing protein [Pilobolus umbonatus]
MDIDNTFIPVTFKPIILLTLGIWGWALDLFILSHSGLDPVSLLQLHQVDKHIPFHKTVFSIATVVSFIVLFNLWLYWYWQSTVIAIVPYITILVFLLWPGKAMYSKERLRFMRMLRRVFSFNLFATVFFSDILLADMLTSVSGVMGDLFVVGCVIIGGKDPSTFLGSVDNVCYHDIIIPLIISVPYLVRLKQCISEYIESKYSRHLYNALKYASSIPVIIFAAAQRKASMYITETGSTPITWYLDEIVIFRLWIFFVFSNSLYSFWWDISMDWNLITITYNTPETEDDKRHQNTPRRKRLLPSIYIRRQLYFSRSIWYIGAVIFDFLLRISWCLKLSSYMYLKQLDSNIFMLQFMEITRRCVWTIFRMESEGVRRVYNSLPTASGHDTFRMGLLDHKTSGLLSPIEEEEA